MKSLIKKVYFKKKIMMAKNKNQINLYYHPDYSLSKKCLAVAEANKAQILPIDISKTKVSQTIWSEMASMLDLKVADLIDKTHDVIIDNFGKEPDIDDFDALKIIEKNPEVINKPIAIRGDKIIRASHAYDLAKLHSSDTGEIKIP